MTEIVPLVCSGCGGKMEVGGAAERFRCPFCGLEHVLNRPPEDRAGLELALQRIERDKDSIMRQLRGLDYPWWAWWTALVLALLGLGSLAAGRWIVMWVWLVPAWLIAYGAHHGYQSEKARLLAESGRLNNEWAKIRGKMR